MKSLQDRKRCLLAILFVALTAPLLLSPAAMASGPTYLVYLGTYSGPSSRGIYALRFDASTGTTSSLGLAAETINPSFLAASPNGRYLYAVNEISDYEGKRSGAVSAFSVDHASGKLTLLNQVSSHGAGPCYVTMDRTGQYVLVANYDSGTVATFPVRANGKLGEAASVIEHSGHGANPKRQEGPHAHQIELSPDNRFAIAVDLGLDKLLVYRFDGVRGVLRANDPPFAEVDAGSGPRHFVFTPDGKFAYVLEEMKSAITAFSYDRERGIFHKLQSTSSLPPTFRNHNDAAEIAVSPSGKHLYASNRGSDTIAVFAMGPEGGLKAIDYVPTGGKTPRGFALDPTGSWLFAANQASNNVVIFRMNQKTGHLRASGQVVKVPTPAAVMFVKQ